jgi:hypothetical protein
MIQIEKFDPEKIFTAIYFEASTSSFYLKRFQIEEETTINKKVDFIGESPGNYLVGMSQDWLPQIRVTFDTKANNKEIPDLIVNASEFIGVKSAKAKGKRITVKVADKIEFIEPLPYDPPEAEDDELIDDEEGEEILSEDDPIQEFPEVKTEHEVVEAEHEPDPVKKIKNIQKKLPETISEENPVLINGLLDENKEVGESEKKQPIKKKEIRKDKPDEGIKQMELF